MQTVIIVIHLLVVLTMIGFVLLQKSEGGALGIGGGGGGFMSSRGTGNLLTRATAFLAAAFFATSLILSILAGWGRQPASIIRTGPTLPSPSAPGPAAPTSGPSILDQLRPTAPATPVTPATPQAPRSQ
jgi:preprotein translocase subunit SecG